MLQLLCTADYACCLDYCGCACCEIPLSGRDTQPQTTKKNGHWRYVAELGPPGRVLRRTGDAEQPVGRSTCVNDNDVSRPKRATAVRPTHRLESEAEHSHSRALDRQISPRPPGAHEQHLPIPADFALFWCGDASAIGMMLARQARSAAPFMPAGRPCSLLVLLCVVVACDALVHLDLLHVIWVRSSHIHM